MKEAEEIDPYATCNGCGINMKESEVVYTTEDGYDYCKDCNEAIQSDDESSGRLDKKQEAIELLGRSLKKSEQQLMLLFMNDLNYEMYKDGNGNLAYRKTYEIGQSVFVREIKTHGIITLKDEGDYYVYLNDGHGGWFNHKEF